jgi:spore photoproduct lyase
MIRKIKRRTMTIKWSGRSSDFISPSFGHGCLLNCSYCYMKRNKPTGLDIPTNIDEILNAIRIHAQFIEIDKPNQTDPEFITYDISCNEDFALHQKYYDWQKIFQFFVDHPRAKATLATKIVPIKFLDFNPKQKVRIRFSLMPQKIADIVEPNTASILERICAINDFIEAGYDVHINFSPVIIQPSWEQDYLDLFQQVNDIVNNKKEVKSEVIFLTHNKNKHSYNIKNNIAGENLLWRPEIQEAKISSYGGKNIRYKKGIKKQFVDRFKQLHGSVIPWNTIRYIF